MFDIWLTESTKLVKEIIDNSSLRAITESVIKEFMATDKFKALVEKQVETQVANAISEYGEFYIFGENGFDEISGKVKKIIAENAKKWTL